MPNHDIRLSNPFAPNCVKALAKIATGSAIAACIFLGAAGHAHSQIQRSFLNLGFEEPALPGDNCWSIRVSGSEPGGTVPGWRTTEGSVSGWGSSVRGNCGGHPDVPPPAGSMQIFKNFGGVTAADGNQWAELNAYSAARLYQNVCLLEGDKVDWYFHHRARFDRQDELEFNIGIDPAGGDSSPIVQGGTDINGAGEIFSGSCMGECNVETIASGWARYHGSFTWDQPSGEQTIGFEAVSGGSAGNYLDAISIVGLVPFVEFDKTKAEGMEGQHDETNPLGNIRVSGNIPAGETFEVVIKIIDLETSAADYEPTGEIVISVPPGDYAGDLFPIPLATLADDEWEPSERLQLILEDKPGQGGYRVANTTTCGDPSVNNVLTYTILGSGVTFLKEGVFVDVVGGIGPDGLPIKRPGDRMDYTFTLTNGGGADLGDIVITDTIVSPVLDVAASDLGTDGRLPPGGVAIYRASYTITQADFDRGEITNVATLTATTPDFPDQPPLTVTDSHTELLPNIPVISMEKIGTVDPETDNGNGLPDPGERIRYDITVTNEGNITALNVRPNDPGPTFNGAPATGMMTPFTPDSVTLLPGAEQVFTAFYTLTEQDIAAAAGTPNGAANQASVTSETPGGEPLNADMPVPTVMTLPGFGVEKRAEITQTQRGGRVPYTITLRPLGLSQPTRVRLADMMPPGFVYMPGTAKVAGATLEPLVEGRRLSWEIDVEPEQDVEVRLVLGVSASVTHGTFTNIAQAERLDSDMVYPQIGRADVEIIPEPVFDCGEIIGKVFNDRNGNGYQDEGETGLPGARVTSVDGIRISTDEHGRFSVACADLPTSRVGASYIMKLDPRSLPTGYRILSENPRVVRMTPGKTTQVNFATSLSRVVRLDLNDAAFQPGSAELSPLWQESIASLVATLEAEPSILRIVYREPNGDRGLANQRMRRLRSMVSQTWKETATRYRLEIEARVEVGHPYMAADD